jgi:diacylglycerol kinase (ATP)
MVRSTVVESVLMFANPIAGRGRGKRIAAVLRRRLAGDGYRVGAFLERPDQTPDVSLPLDPPPRAVIAVGGDGTLRGVAQRLLERYGPEALPPILVVPLGTANLMGKHLGVNWQDATLPQRVSDAIAQRRIVRLDAATANGKPFLLMAGIGIDAHIVHELDRSRSGPIDITSYALPAAVAFGSYSYAPVQVELDGKAAFTSAPAMVFVGNVPEYGTGFPILPLARADDGLLDVCVLPCRSRAELLQLFLLVASGDHVRAPGVVYRTATTVRVTSDLDIPVQVDGEAAGHTPVYIEMLPTRIPFVAPAQYK